MLAWLMNLGFAGGGAVPAVARTSGQIEVWDDDRGDSSITRPGGDILHAGRVVKVPKEVT